MNNLLTSACVTTLIALSVLNAPNTLANPTEPAKPAKPTSFDASVYVTKANKIRLAVEKTTSDPLTISLHEVGKKTALFSQQIGRKQSKAALQLDVDQLPDGVYELEIKSASGSIIKQVNLGAPATAVVSERLLAIQ